jgi:hypothetical protein
MTTFDKEEVTLSFQFGKGLSELTGSIQKNTPSRSLIDGKSLKLYKM